jgi:hypothetical protein
MSFQRMRNWLLSQSPSRPRRAAVRSARRGCRPNLEVLEDRLVLSTFSVAGTTLNVTGTVGNDSFAFAPSSTKYLVKMNGASYTVDPTAIHSIVVDCQGGSDVANLTGGKGPNNLQLSPYGGTLTGADYKVTLKSTEIIAAFGKGSDTATLNTGTGSATFWAGIGLLGYPQVGAQMGGAGWYNDASGFGTIFANNQGLASNSAKFYGSKQHANAFYGSSTAATLGDVEYQATASGFGNVVAFAGGGATDIAVLSGSTVVPNNFQGRTGDSTLSGSGYSLEAKGFAYVVANGGKSGAADLYDAAGGATFVGGPGYGSFAYGNGTQVEADGFAAVTGHSTAAGDWAQLYADHDHASHLHADVGGVTVSSSVGWVKLDLQPNGFSHIKASTTSASDTAFVNNGNTNYAMGMKLSLLPYSLELDGPWAGMHSSWDL